jgi:hypothetical protein
MPPWGVPALRARTLASQHCTVCWPPRRRSGEGSRRPLLISSVPVAMSLAGRTARRLPTSRSSTSPTATAGSIALTSPKACAISLSSTRPACPCCCTPSGAPAVRRQTSVRSSTSPFPHGVRPMAPPPWGPIGRSRVPRTCQSSLIPASSGGPATWRDAQAVVAQAAPQTRAPRTAGSRSHVVGSSAGGIAQRWLLLSSAQRQPQAQRTVDTPWRKHRHQEVSACQTLGRTALACAADAPPARTRFAAGWQTTLLHDSPVGPTPPSGKRGRPGPGAQPDQSVSHSTGAWASRLTDRRARVAPQRGLLLATHERDEGQ